jgi:hypothetical protein
MLHDGNERTQVAGVLVKRNRDFTVKPSNLKTITDEIVEHKSQKDSSGFKLIN